MTKFSTVPTIDNLTDAELDRMEAQEPPSIRPLNVLHVNDYSAQIAQNKIDRLRREAAKKAQREKLVDATAAIVECGFVRGDRVCRKRDKWQTLGHITQLEFGSKSGRVRVRVQWTEAMNGARRMNGNSYGKLDWHYADDLRIALPAISFGEFVRARIGETLSRKAEHGSYLENDYQFNLNDLPERPESYREVKVAAVQSGKYLPVDLKGLWFAWREYMAGGEA